MTRYVPAEGGRGLKVKVFEASEKVTQSGFDRIVIEQASDSGSFIPGRA